MHQFLRSRAERLPQVGNLALVSADGIRVNYSLRWPALAVDMSDRDYARHFSIEDDPGLFISQPVINRESSDICMVALSVAAGQRPTWRVPWHGPGVDAAQCHRRPLSVDHPAERPVDCAVAARWHHAVEQSQSRGIRSERRCRPLPVGNPWWRGAAVTTNRLGFSTRSHGWFAVQPLPDYPLVIDVGLSKDAALAHWRREARMIAFGAAVALGCMALMLHRLRV
jgi:hypothetical protein